MLKTFFTQIGVKYDKTGFIIKKLYPEKLLSAWQAKKVKQLVNK